MMMMMQEMWHDHSGIGPGLAALDKEDQRLVVEWEEKLRDITHLPATGGEDTNEPCEGRR